VFIIWLILARLITSAARRASEGCGRHFFAFGFHAALYDEEFFWPLTNIWAFSVEDEMVADFTKLFMKLLVTWLRLSIGSSALLTQQYKALQRLLGMSGVLKQVVEFMYITWRRGIPKSLTLYQQTNCRNS